MVFVLLHMGIGPAAKDTEVGDGWFSIIEGFIGCFAFDSRGGGEVESMEVAGECLSPKLSWKVGIREQGCYPFV